MIEKGMKFKIYIYRGALIDQACLNNLTVKVLRTSKNPNWGDWMELIVDKNQFRRVQENLVKHYVGSEPWYTYGFSVNDPNQVIVGFGADDGENGKVFEFRKDDEESYQKMVDYGVSKGIPAWEMDFLLINRRKAKAKKVNKYYQEIFQKIKAASHSEKTTLHPENYSGSNHISYNLITADSRKIAKDWVNKYHDISLEELVETLNVLSEGQSSDEKMMIGKILGYLPKRRREIDPKFMDHWLDDLVGWSEVDSLCQSNLTDKDLLANWEKWEQILKKFSKDQNISKRRASLVLLTAPVSHNTDERLARMALKNIDNLKSERNILITKAISWLLRDLTKLHRQEVEQYLKDNSETLPPIAVRETRSKLDTGKKYKKCHNPN